MKKTVLLSLAAATALTFGATTNYAKADTIQPEVQQITYTTPFQFLYKSTNQTEEIQKLLASIFGQQIIWKSILIQPGNVAALQPTVPSAGTTTQTTVPKPASKPTTTPAPAAKLTSKSTTAAATTAKPASKPTTTPAPAAKPASKVTTTSAPKSTSTANALSQYEQRVVDLTNAERAKYGLPALKVDLELSKVAKAKSQDMYNKNYFDHNSPTYGSPFTMMKQFGISYRSAGENIAMGQRTPEEVVQAWMNSEGHRANILNSTYTHIGVGYVAGKNIWTQEFISK